MSRRVRVIWELYRPVRAWLAAYVASVIVAVFVEGLALAAIVPLIEAGSGRIEGFYGDLLVAVGLDAESEADLVLVVGVLFVLRALGQYASRVLASTMVLRQAVAMQVSLFRSYLDVRWEVALRLAQGQANLLLGTQTQQAAWFLRRLVSLAEGAMYVVGLTVVSVVVSPENTLVAIGLVGTSAVCVSLLANRVQRVADQILRSTKDQAAVLLQYARGTQLLRAYGVSDRAADEVAALAKEREAYAFRSEKIQALAQVLPDLAFVLALLAVVAVAFRSDGGFAEVGAVVALLFRVSQYLKRFADLAALSDLLPAVKEVHRHQVLFDENRSRQVGAPSDLSLQPGTVIIHDVSFQYDNSSTEAVRGITKEIKPGEFVGIVGSSGSGKSTLISLIVGLLDVQQGAVRIGERSTGEGRGLAYVSQTPFVLKGTIADNVRWFRSISDERVAQACGDAGLDPILDRLPAGVETVIEEEGLTLSGGERQRLALARALAGDPQILVLDEATSALDSESEAAVQSALELLRGRVTIIAVAHRLATVLDADRIWVMEHGRIIEDGPPELLLAERGSRFAQLGALQGLEAGSRPAGRRTDVEGRALEPGHGSTRPGSAQK